MNKSVISGNPVVSLEINEIIKKLKDHGYGEIVDCLLENEGKVYTKKGRLNKSSTCREMGWKNKQLDDAIRDMRELLKGDFDLEVTS